MPRRIACGRAACALFPFAFSFPGAFAFLLPGPAGQRLDWLRGGLGLLQLEVSEKRFPVLGCYYFCEAVGILYEQCVSFYMGDHQINL